ncbi:MAG: DUF455 family protein [Planctomycetota bacterium]|nr:MAG: DUF455 family protein [Planctomycetota bacterium]
MSGTPIEREPPGGTVERWCWDFVRSCELAVKLDPPRAPDPTAASSWEAGALARRIAGPGRPPELRVAARAPRTPAPGALVRPEARARLVHTFLHHELQAAELFAWAVLAFPESPRPFRAGLLRLCREELAHLALYERHLARLGFAVGTFPVRDWFWERVVRCESAEAFVALLGLGLEGANLEHTARFATLFRAAGDEEGALILERIEEDEIGHVAFAVHWFEHLAGAPLDYERWRAALPAPLTPAVLQGRPLNRSARRRAGLDESFLAQLAAEPPTTARRPG